MRCDLRTYWVCSAVLLAGSALAIQADLNLEPCMGPFVVSTGLFTTMRRNNEPRPTPHSPQGVRGRTVGWTAFALLLVYSSQGVPCIATVITRVVTAEPSPEGSLR